MINTLIINALDRVEVPYKYRIFRDKEIVPPPFIIYTIDREQHYGSDVRNRIIKSDIVVELFTTRKDFDIEQKIEAAFSAYEFKKTEVFNEGDEVYIITYEIFITIKGDNY